MSVNIDGDLSKPRRRNIMRAFKISEISAVDRPAQEGAKAAIIKRNTNDGELSMPTEKEFQKKLDDLAAELAKVKTDSEAKIGELSTANAELVTKAAAATEAAEFATAVSKMTPAQQAFLDRVKGKGKDGKEPDEDDTKKVRKAFVAMTSAQRDEYMTEKSAGDEVITIDGEEMRKSVIGATQFNVLKRQSERVAALEKSSKDAIEKAETVELAKRADEEFAHLPGTTEDKVSVLRVIGKSDKKVQETFATMIKAGEKAIKGAFEKLGHRGGSPSVDKGEFEKRVAEVRARDGSSRMDAMEKARKEFPVEFEAYQGQN
jgi:hypothetical protein